tara:strand:- start:1008 stop:1442 length:435 start_codon:yes stop_codon:yes gene_type:complete
MEDTIIKNNLRFKTVRLSNQLIVGNFSSPHPFTFEDGSVLDAVSDYDSMRLKVIFNETIVQERSTVMTVSLDFSLTADVLEEMEIWTKMWKHNDVDIVLCALPMIQALQKNIVNDDYHILDSPFRAVRLKNRIKKLASIDTFSI